MKEKEYNDLLANVSSRIGGINQIIFEVLILLVLYIFINRILSSKTDGYIFLSNNSKSVVILLCIFAVALDWFIWNNLLQTLLFASILLIYIRYNINNFKLISTFINMTGNELQTANALSISSEPVVDTKECSAPVIPELDLVSLPYDNKNVHPYGIMAFDKTESSIHAINDVYKSDKPYVTITDSAYAKIMLNELYQTPQYQNTHTYNEIDSSLANDIHYSANNSSQNQNMTDNERDVALLNSFKNPEKRFLDDRWLSSNGTYNDNCKVSGCGKETPIVGKKKDAICNVVHFGKPLEQCTNQENTISIDQLENISNNEIKHMEI